MDVQGLADRPLTRRGLSISGLVGLVLVLGAAAPLWLLLAAVLDLLTGPRRMRHLRLLSLVALLALLELIALAVCGLVWVLAGGGRLLDRRPFQWLHHRLQWSWTSSILLAAKTTVGLELDVQRFDPTNHQPLVVLARHTCIADAVLPTVLLGQHRRYRLRHVLKHDLQWAPSLDVVGHRIPNAFVTRENSGDPTTTGVNTAAIAVLARGIGTDEAVVIFPEGTFFRPERLQRSLDRIALRDPARADRLAGLQHLLPIQPGGTLAALDVAPDAAVAILQHHGLESFESFGDIYRSVPFKSPVVIDVRVIPREEVPSSGDALVRWLDDQWLAGDAWIAERMGERERR